MSIIVNAIEDAIYQDYCLESWETFKDERVIRIARSDQGTIYISRTPYNGDWLDKTICTISLAMPKREYRQIEYGPQRGQYINRYI